MRLGSIGLEVSRRRFGVEDANAQVRDEEKKSSGSQIGVAGVVFCRQRSRNEDMGGSRREMMGNGESRSVAEEGYLGFCLFSHCDSAESALPRLIFIIITPFRAFTLKYYCYIRLSATL